MRSKLIKILIAVVVVVAVFLVIVALQPEDYKVERQTTIAAPPSAPFNLVNNFKKWGSWSPWENLDPSLTRTFKGPEEGVGAIYHWSGNSKVGEGEMTITESRPSESIRIKLEFIKPFADISDTVFSFKPEGDKTVVTWTMTGKKPFMSKAICLFVSMDKMIGGQFEQGLSQMKAAAEAPPKA